MPPCLYLRDWYESGKSLHSDQAYRLPYLPTLVSPFHAANQVTTTNGPRSWRDLRRLDFLTHFSRFCATDRGQRGGT